MQYITSDTIVVVMLVSMRFTSIFGACNEDHHIQTLGTITYSKAVAFKFRNQMYYIAHG